MQELWNLIWPVLIVAAMIYAAMVLIQLLGGRASMPYHSRKRLVTNSELRFFRQLREGVRDDWEIFAMVRVADILQVPKGTKNRRSWLNKILSKHIDFVICDTETLEVLAGIELDDASHQQSHRIERDRFINAAFGDAGIPLLRVPVQKSYDAREIRKQIEQAI